MKKLSAPSFIPLLSLFISSLAHGIGGNPDDTWYYVSISGVEGVTGSETAFVEMGEAEAFMRQTVPYGNNLVLRDTSGTEPNKSYYYHIEDEEIIPGTAWGYRDRLHSGIYGSEQGAVDQFLADSNYQCIEENGPMGTWNVGSVWYCYPQYNGYTAPYTREIATYNLDVNTSAQCDGGTINVDPVFCRIRQDSCPDHTPTLYGGQCTSNVTATIYQYKCDCNETGITGACVAVPTDTLNYLDAMGTFHSTIVAQDSQYNQLSCQEKIEIPRKCPKDSPEFPFKGNPINIT
ncbi:MAG: hypothetical protein KZQ77_00545, partial [Candidatus Thiodiazotropha sp. (ex Notomyrtea botanica)]|nr:hypothetical protein [Candidatus Thiodiazotropha sp. (ex Notomyrtea botanica)]